MDWLDTRAPALENKTPRQAARTARGRERLDALTNSPSAGQDHRGDERSTTKQVCAIGSIDYFGSCVPIEWNQ
ncbi:MAG: hypothetical protein HYX76_00410 [Acidobacteria bacterium]|nr:hypothetical protein [Acidobacteriota bacterium]